MKNANAIRPKSQDLNESIRRPEDILKIRPEVLMVEPKFDGSFVYVTHDPVANRTVLCTKDGNELHLYPPAQDFILRHFGPFTAGFLFEAELEPFPWSEAKKVALNGNLYSGKHLPFSMRLVVHDILPMDEIQKPRSTARQRYALLRSLVNAPAAEVGTTPILWAQAEEIRICITPCLEIGRAAAVKLFRESWALGQCQRRVVLGNQPYEGLVLVDPESIYLAGRRNKWKVKPFHTVDICVTELLESRDGKVPSYAIHGFDIKTGQSAKITSGVSPTLYAQLQNVKKLYPEVYIEVEVSSLRELASANPTVQRIRFDRMGSPSTSLLGTGPAHIETVIP